MAEGVLRKLAHEAGLAEVDIRSAGTRARPGQPADPRAVAAAATRGIDLSGHTSRLLEAAEIARFDLVLAMERRHLAEIAVLADGGMLADQCRVLMSFVSGGAPDVPDPFDGTPEDYLFAIAEIERACRGILTTLTPNGASRPRHGDGRH